MDKSKRIKHNNGKGTKFIVPPGITEFRLTSIAVFPKSLKEPEMWGVLTVTNNEDIVLYNKELNIENVKIESNRVLKLLNERVIVFQQPLIWVKYVSVAQSEDYSKDPIVYFQLNELPPISVNSPEEEFEEHLDDYNNFKIVFSAPFGSGKSYFLDYFFDKNSEQYEVYKVYPVNYSVASNEDIFKYIKADLLFQLMGKDVDFEQEGISFSQAIQEYIFLNPVKTMVSLVENFSKLNSKTEIIGKTISSIRAFIKPIQEYQQNQKVDDKEISSDFIKELYEAEGSLFEDNIYTQIIRQLLERLKEINNKKSVLVIEDLDRMDPEHVFRILNVISAHYDTFKYGQNESSDEDFHNKFGFDRIVVVCDKNNIEAIFKHRFGKEVDFGGYFNKFFSSKPFDFNNLQQIAYSLENICKEINHFDKNPIISARLLELLIDLHSKQKITLRDVIKLTQTNFDLKKYAIYDFQGIMKMSPYTIPIVFLIDTLGYSNLLSKFELIQNSLTYIKGDFDEKSRILLAALGKREGKECETNYGDYKVKFKIKEAFEHRLIESVYDLSFFNSKISNTEIGITFEAQAYYELLIKNIKHIKVEMDSSR